MSPMRADAAVPSRFHLQPRPGPGGLGPAVRSFLVVLQEYLEEDVQVLVRVLVDAMMRRRHARSRAADRLPSTSIQELNRGRRAARSWLHAILSGRIDQGTRHAMLHVWLPELGLSAHAADWREVQDTFELLRGAATGLIAGAPEDNLVPQAKAVHALDAVLALHLGFVEVAIRNAWHREALAPVGR